MKNGDKFLDYYGNTYTFLEYYNEGRDSDFLALDDQGRERNFMEDQVKHKILTAEEQIASDLMDEKIAKVGL